MSKPGLDQIIADPPPVHMGGSGAYALHKDTLRFIANAIDPDRRTVETGLGASTAMFALSGCDHLAITPAAAEVDGLRRYAERSGIDLSRVRFETGFSQHVLPALAPELRFDLALIDGGHGFPIPFVDWLYISERLKPGGLLVVDDTHLWTGAVLRDFLLREPDWKSEARFTRSEVFRLTAPFRVRDWTAQPYVSARSRVSRFLAAQRSGFQMLRRGEFSNVLARLREFRRRARLRHPAP